MCAFLPCISRLFIASVKCIQTITCSHTHTHSLFRYFSLLSFFLFISFLLFLLVLLLPFVYFCSFFDCTFSVSISHERTQLFTINSCKHTMPTLSPLPLPYSIQMDVQIYLFRSNISFLVFSFYIRSLLCFQPLAYNRGHYKHEMNSAERKKNTKLSGGSWNCVNVICKPKRNHLFFFCSFNCSWIF